MQINLVLNCVLPCVECLEATESVDENATNSLLFRRILTVDQREAALLP